ncbi:hypothetical protein ACHAXA_004900 [Cyclostephanos tholiformis]|uniref:PH domain-containing protein n=1 Tax=Cyclostephanos tholiformis TaxID=382380 RepID=A0ABD3RX28_9STRA
MSNNLSELSIQLRKLQAEKNAQANEIDRLERQARILAELKGVSINDVKNSLKAACEAEAHGELRALVGTLQARVEGLQLGGGGIVRGQRGLGGNADADKVPSQDRFNQEQAARARTALELRIGELEEIESSHQRELDFLYKQSQELTDKNTRLETQLMQQQAILEQWELRWKARDENDMTRSIAAATAPSTGGAYNYSEFAKVPVASQLDLLHDAPQSQIDADHEQRFIAAQAALAGERNQRLLVQSQLSSAQKNYELRSDQHQHRIQFLEGQLQDLELQMTSLYVAFGMIQNDNKEERSEKEAWKKSLVESDAALAKEETKRSERESWMRFLGESDSALAIEESKRDQKQHLRPSGIYNGQQVSPDSERSNRRSVSRVHNPSLSSDRRLSSLVRAAVKPSANPPIARGLLLLLLDDDDQPVSPSINPSRSIQRKKTFSARRLYPMKSSSRLSILSAGNKFKEQYCVLHGANGLYQIRYGDSYEGPVAGVHEFITAGVSAIEHTSRSSNQPFGFEIMINPSSADSPVLCCAAESEDDFMMWMSALTSVIDGSLDQQSERN